jgi:micrococcal nuclease
MFKKFMTSTAVALVLAVSVTGVAYTRSAYHSNFSAYSQTTTEFAATVTTCHDGDSCLIQTRDQQIHVRLHGIDTPEIDQPYGLEARAVVLKLVLGRQVKVRPVGSSYKRMVVSLVLADGPDAGADISAFLVNVGAAWVEPRYNRDSTAPARQAEAQRQRLGLWADSNPIAPWDWRHSHEQRGGGR